MYKKQPSVNVHQFAMVPKADIPRSSFRRQSTHKTTFDAGYLVPVYLDEVLPGDTFNLKMTAFARMATPIFPVMDNMYLDSFFFFVPNRLVWDNWVRFMGEQDNPADSISYSVPSFATSAADFLTGSVYDYFGLPGPNQITSNVTKVSVLPLRAYNLIWNQWFRDENLQNSVTVRKTDAGDAYADFTLLRRGKRHDYFTSSLPWVQKGNTSVTLPLGTTAPIKGLGLPNPHLAGASISSNLETQGSRTMPFGVSVGGAGLMNLEVASASTTALPLIFADLSAATAATINQIRQAFQIQKLLERDARGGTRYTEIVRAHFGVMSPDARLQRAEYLGGGSSPVNIHTITQNTQTGLTGGTTPIGTVSGAATVTAHHGFTQSFTEHGHVIGLVAVRADLTYQQGIRKMWRRSTRYDFYFPVFASLGEQAILQSEIFATGVQASDDTVFGYQERWAEYRFLPSQVSGLFRSTASGTIDSWHLAQKFTVAPTLNTTFIQDTPPVSRVVAVGAGANGQQFIFDSFFDIKTARCMPTYSVPGLVDHF